jgi:hypothetical protein
VGVGRLCLCVCVCVCVCVCAILSRVTEDAMAMPACVSTATLSDDPGMMMMMPTQRALLVAVFSDRP